MGYMLCHGSCINCNKLFSFNPDRVPSIRINGEREPLCRPCMESINSMRKDKGVPALVVNADAYTPLECP